MSPMPPYQPLARTITPFARDGVPFGQPLPKGTFATPPRRVGGGYVIMARDNTTGHWHRYQVRGVAVQLFGGYDA